MVRAFQDKHVFPFGAIELMGDDGRTFLVNSQRLKHYYGGEEQNVNKIPLADPT